MREAHIDFVRFTINTPFPGTDYYTKMKQTGRIITDDYSKYDCMHCIIKPENFTPQQVEQMQKRMWRKAYSIVNILRRLAYKQPVSAFILNFIVNYYTGRFFNTKFKN